MFSQNAGKESYLASVGPDFQGPVLPRNYLWLWEAPRHHLWCQAFQHSLLASSSWWLTLVLLVAFGLCFCPHGFVCFSDWPVPNPALPSGWVSLASKLRQEDFFSIQRFNWHESFKKIKVQIFRQNIKSNISNKIWNVRTRLGKHILKFRCINEVIYCGSTVDLASFCFVLKKKMYSCLNQLHSQMLQSREGVSSQGLQPEAHQIDFPD